MSWIPTVNTVGDPADVFTGNGMRFATREEAQRWADDLALRWTAVRDTGVKESDDPVNYAIVDDRVVRIEEEARPVAAIFHGEEDS